MALPRWTADEWIIALDFYHRYRDKVPSKTSREIKKLSTALRRVRKEIAKKISKEEQKKFRNPDGVYMQVMTLAGLDPDYLRKGMSKPGGIVEEVWKNYGNKTDEVSRLAKHILEGVGEGMDAPLVIDAPEGMEYAQEGRILSRRHWVRERDQGIVGRKKKSFFKLYKDIFCEICDFNYRKNYGERGDGYIECHHIKPISELNAGAKIYMRDLILICASCHRIIHRKKPWITPEAVKTLLKARPYD